MANPASKKPKALSEYQESVAPAEEISRPTQELVIGMVGAVGAGVSTTARVLKDILERDYGYSVRILKASKLIEENATKVGWNATADSGAQRIKDLQEIGTKLRNQYDQDYLAAKAVEVIALARADNLDGYDLSTRVPQANSLRQATIFDSLKHPDESKLFRRVYGGMYWQFTVFAPESVRDHRLRAQGVEKEQLPGIFTRDENDREGEHGQKVSKTAHLSDFFVRNDGENDVRLNEVIERFLEVVFNISVHTPTRDEAGMYAAVSAASKSACLSRQVGAAVYSAKGELVGVGWNDVPKATGGLYSTEDDKKDHRCFRWGEKLCHNHRKKEELYGRIFKELMEEGLLASGVTKKLLRASLLKTPVKDLIEYDLLP